MSLSGTSNLVTASRAALLDDFLASKNPIAESKLQPGKLIRESATSCHFVAHLMIGEILPDISS
jgi:hypothetical protein